MVMDVRWRRLCVSMIRERVIYLFRVGSWERVRRLMRGSVSSELLICGGRVRSIFYIASCGQMHRENRCVYIIIYNIYNNII